MQENPPEVLGSAARVHGRLDFDTVRPPGCEEAWRLEDTLPARPPRFSREQGRRTAQQEYIPTLV